MNVNMNSKAGTRMASPEPYNLYQPSNIITILSFFSPIILMVLVLSHSIFSQNVKGLFYLVFAAIGLGIRSLFIQSQGGSIGPNENRGEKGYIRYGKYGNATLTIFLFAFTFVYLLVPMFVGGVTNWLIILVLCIYICLDVGMKIVYSWINMSKDFTSILADFITGVFFGSFCLYIMYLLHLEKYMYFGDEVNNGTICSRPQQQTFKCLVYKNGQLVQS